MRHHGATSRPPRRSGFTLTEVLVVLTIMGVMIAIPVPSFMRAIEQSKLDVAAGNLRAIWSAQRFYRLEHPTYGSLAELAPGTSDDDLIGPTLTSGETFYAYTITLSEGSLSFVATARHPDNPRCNGSLTIDDRGTITSEVTYNSQPMSPSMEPGS